GMVQPFLMSENPATFKLGRAFAWGSVEVFDELRNGSDSRFESFRNDPQIKRLVSNNPPVDEVEADEAAIVARSIIKLTSENLALLAPNKRDVGTTSDCALITKADGFKWLHQDVPASAPKAIPPSSKIRKRKKRWKKRKRR